LRVVEGCPVCTEDAEFIRTTRRPSYEAPTSKVRVVDLFSGGGGLTLGFAEAAKRIGRGIKIVLAVELDLDAADVFELNFPRVKVTRRRVEALFPGAPGTRATRAESTLASEIGKVDVLLAGPPCQGHSDLNNHTRRDDVRNELYVRVARAAEILHPRAVIIENVPAVQHDARGAVPAARRVLEKADYRVKTAVLDLTELGVPQRRRRHVLLALRDGSVDPAAILGTAIACCDHTERSVEWAIGDLTGLTAPGGPDTPSAASAENLERMQWLVDNDEYDLPNERRPVCHRGDHSYVSMYGRLSWNKPAQTITTGYGSTGQGRYVHPAEPRTITPHEAARLQTLPDFFDLGSDKKRGTWAHVIGNAVPPLLGVHVGTPLLLALFPPKKGDRIATRGTTSRPRRTSFPPASSEVIRERMRTTKRRDTKPELLLRSELDSQGLRYAVDHAVDGTRRRADIVFKGARVAVYIDGCYWHGCPSHGSLPKSNGEAWKEKFDANRSRDADTDARLAAAGWTVMRFWEHDDPVESAAKVVAVVRGAPAGSRSTSGRRASPRPAATRSDDAPYRGHSHPRESLA
jgi:DNA (cytosine-5)-methyltransferase 1